VEKQVYNGDVRPGRRGMKNKVQACTARGGSTYIRHLGGDGYEQQNISLDGGNYIGAAINADREL
jgi:hypothetical protein